MDGQPVAKEWWDDTENFHPISEWTLQRNEYIEVSEQQQQAAYDPVRVDDAKSEQEDSDEENNSEETDEEFDWFDPKKGHEEDSYFVFVNKGRKTIKRGKQAFYCYG